MSYDMMIVLVQYAEPNNTVEQPTIAEQERKCLNILIN